MSITPETNATLEEIAALLEKHDSFAICGHVSPDGDCLGSQLALADALRRRGKDVTCLLARDEPINPTLAFLPGSDELVAAARFEGSAEVFIAVDVPIRERLCDAQGMLEASEVSVTLDHHASRQRMTDFAYIDPDAASASMIIWELVKLLVDQPSLQSALCAYTGLVTDTGGFRFQNVDARAFSCAAELVARGVDASDVATKVFQNRSLASLKLEQELIGRMKVLFGGTVALSWVEEADLEALGATKSDTEPLVNVMRELDSAQVVCLLRQVGETARGSLRSKGDADVSELARKFDGGGHRAAAGFTLDMPILQAVDLMEHELEIYS